MHKRTKIVCTLGPATETVDAITRMVKAGMNVARLNFSHGTHENHLMLISRVRAVAKELNMPIAIMQDLQGPKIRIGVLPDGGIMLNQGDTVCFDTGTDVYRDGIIPVDYTELHEHVKSGERLFLNDGRIETNILRVEGTKIITEIVVGGPISSHKGINVPDSTMAVRVLTDKDKEDLKFGVENGVDLVAVSFVRGPEDILDVRYLIKQYETELGIHSDQPIRLIAKIERHEAVKRIKEILDVTDGIMVARGDLGVEIPGQTVPLVQKDLIRHALAVAKPVIVATQMLDSMQENPRPTRAEVSDVANAVIDHTDAVMLSNETATGKYPIDAVTMMSKIIMETEASTYDDFPVTIEATKTKKKTESVDDIMSGLARLLAERVNATMILAASLTGDTGRMISRYRPELPIFVGTSSERIERQLNLSWGVMPFALQPCATIEELIDRSLLHLKKAKHIHTGDKTVIVAGEPVGQSGHVNLLEVREIE